MWYNYAEYAEYGGIAMSLAISVNDLKRLGSHAIDEQLRLTHEIVVTSHGKNKYAIMDYNEWVQLQDDLLELAYLKVCKQIDNGEGVIETADEHIQRIEKLLADG